MDLQYFPGKRGITTLKSGMEFETHAKNSFCPHFLLENHNQSSGKILKMEADEGIQILSCKDFAL